MVKRACNAPDQEPEESNFQLPSEKEHLLQVVDVTPLIKTSGEDESVQIVHLEVVGGEEEGRSLLNRVNLDTEAKAFYFSRLFLKAIGEPYKGKFEIDTDSWIGKQFYSTVKHSKSKDGLKTYANIDQYNFEKKVEHPVVSGNPGGVKDPKDIEIAWEE